MPARSDSKEIPWIQFYNFWTTDQVRGDNIQNIRDNNPQKSLYFIGILYILDWYILWILPVIPVVLMNFLLAISTTIAMTILPLLTTEKIGLSIFIFGLIEGFTEFLSNILRLVSGSLFDRMKRKKNLFVLSAGFALASKITLLIPSFAGVFSSKIFERLANGLFAAPRDAFVGQNAKNKGLALAILSCSKTLGCVLGPVIVSVAVYFLGDLNSQIYNLIIFSGGLVIVAMISSFFIKNKSLKIDRLMEQEFILSSVLSVMRTLAPLLIISILFFLGRFNDGMIMLYLKKSGLPEWFYLSTVGFFNVIMFVVSPVLGMMIDRSKANITLYITVIALLVFNISFYFIDMFPFALAAFGLIAWGVQRVGAQITFSAMIFRSISEKYYGTAIGIYSLLSGVGNLIASSICGHLASSYSFDYVFLFSGFCSLVCLTTTIIFYRKKYLS